MEPLGLRTAVLLQVAVSLCYCSAVGDRTHVVQHGVTRNLTVIEGESVHLYCRFNGSTSDSSHQVQWHLNQSDITRGDDEAVDTEKYVTSRMSPDKGEILTVKHVDETDQGYYGCVLKETGNDTVSVGKVYMKVIPIPSFRQMPADQDVAEGQNATLPCRLKNFDGEHFDVSWFRNGARISRSYNITLPRQSSLVGQFNIQGDRESGVYDLGAMDINRQTAGFFHCEAYSINGGKHKVRSVTAHVKVLHPPKEGYPRCEPSSLRAYYREGYRLKTKCSSRGGNAPVYFEWIRGGDIKNVTVSTLNPIVNERWALKAEDDGVYIVCSLKGPAIIKPRECTIGPINVHYGPIITISPDVATVSIGNNATFNCTVRSNPKTVGEYFWVVNGIRVAQSEKYKLVHSDDGSELTIHEVAEADNITMVTCLLGGDETVKASAWLYVLQSRTTVVTTTIAPPMSTVSTETLPSTFQSYKEAERLSNQGLSLVHILVICVVLLIIASLMIVFVLRKYFETERGKQRRNEEESANKSDLSHKNVDSDDYQDDKEEELEQPFDNQQKFEDLEAY